MHKSSKSVSVINQDFMIKLKYVSEAMKENFRFYLQGVPPTTPIKTILEPLAQTIAEL